MSLTHNRSKKIIIYSSSPYFDTWPKKLQLEEFKYYNLDLELWSTENIFYEKENISAATRGSDQYIYKDLNVIKIKNISELEKKISKLSYETIVCIMTLGNLNNNKFDNPDLDLLNKYKIKYVFHHMVPHLVPSDIWSKFKFSIKLFQKRFYSRKKKPYLIIGSGTEGRKQALKIYKNNFVYKSVPSFNILWSKHDPIIVKKYIVYVEEAVDSPPDAALFGIDNPNLDIEGFYKRINSVFDKIESWTGYRIVIAASGKYRYNKNPFKNREIIYKKTPILIQHSELVIGHKSLGVEQAIVDFKPLLLFKDQGFNNLKNKIIENLARVYGLNFLWTDKFKESNFKKNYNVNVDNNKKIIKKYFKEDNIKGSFVEHITSAFHNN